MINYSGLLYLKGLILLRIEVLGIRGCAETLAWIGLVLNCIMGLFGG